MADDGLHEEISNEDQIKQIEEQVAKLHEELEAQRKEADKLAAERQKEIEVENEKARKPVPYDIALNTAGLKHLRQDNEGDEDYSELPKSINLAGPEEADPSDLAPPDQATAPEPYEPIYVPPLPDYPDQASEPESLPVEPPPVR